MCWYTKWRGRLKIYFCPLEARSTCARMVFFSPFRTATTGCRQSTRKRVHCFFQYSRLIINQTLRPSTTAKIVRTKLKLLPNNTGMLKKGLGFGVSSPSLCLAIYFIWCTLELERHTWYWIITSHVPFPLTARNKERVMVLQRNRGLGHPSLLKTQGYPGNIRRWLLLIGKMYYWKLRDRLLPFDQRWLEADFVHRVLRWQKCKSATSFCLARYYSYGGTGLLSFNQKPFCGALRWQNVKAGH